MALHRYAIVFQTKTGRSFSFSQLMNQYGTSQSFINDMSTQARATIGEAIRQAYAQKGVAVSVISATFSRGELIFINDTEVKLESSWNATIETDADFFQSPLAPLVIIAIGIAVAFVIAAFVVPPLIADWLKSMTVKTTTVTKYDWILNPSTGEYEWLPVSTETVTEPDIGGILAVAAGIAVVFASIIIVIALAWRFKGGK